MIKVKLSEKVIPAFYDFWKNCDKYLYKVLKGGRNSSKSSHISIKIITELMKKTINALVVRKVGNTLETSVYEQLIWAIEHLEVSDYWHIQKSPLKLIYKPTGNYIIFRGADKPEKIKSIKTSKYPIAILWIEELAEFKTEEEISTIVNSVIRAELPKGLNYSIFYSYNPPKRKQSWVNKKYETQFIADNTYIHHSTYLDNPYVSKAFIEEAEEVKKKNEYKYSHEYLGEPIGSGIVPFNNLVFRKITDDEIRSFDNIRQGIDWGYAADPFAFVRWHYDKTRRKLYCIDELYGVKLSNREVAEWIKNKKYNDFRIIADSVEPKSIAELKSYGINIVGAKKGPGSVEYGEKWLDDLDEIVIDPDRTPNIAKEFESIDYQVDKDGNIKSKLEDKDNHTIDATRYATENDQKYKQSIQFLI
ncbi:PBSX family phage terminase large subunit [Crassaminicella thermophila]|uniref:PBSX family phage terminase large subunit n=1 Tax=Crassaminicella thermophila TaxID=2599308 RepID=A0A5C0SAS6_CRATE|nr:PBSX family phage terminase large subunit [Crassaminicella thermophila]QEK11683.1 PBSX family phage terminase large subunit [Crassaminicella thermophila]